MPILVPETPIDADCITIRNIGNGPALNIVIATVRAEARARTAGGSTAPSA
jgi:hypothetical protein